MEVITSKFVKPLQKDVEIYLKGNFALKQVFIHIAEIRKVELKGPNDTQNIVSSVVCSCPEHS